VTADNEPDKGTVYREIPELEPDAAPEAAPVASDVATLKAEAGVLEARANLIKAETAGAKAQQPLIDRIIMRGLIPVALTVVGPWALYVFNADNEKTHAQVAEVESVVADLGDLLAQATQEREARTEIAQRAEIARAAELHALSEMVVRLQAALRQLSVRQAVRDALRVAPPTVTVPFFMPDDPHSGEQPGAEPPPPMPTPGDDQARVVEQAMIQLQDAALGEEEMATLREEANQAYERLQEQVQQQRN